MSKSETQTPQQRKMYLIADEIGLTRPERIELARYLLRRDLTSFRSLDDDQVLRILDALEGYQLVSNLFMQRP